jgi:acyl carrier protein
MPSIKDEIMSMISPESEGANTDADLREDLGIDSIRLIALVVALERKHGIEFLFEEIKYDNISTVDKIAALVESKIAAA